jgi:arylsulfatase A-like enzyme
MSRHKISRRAFSRRAALAIAATALHAVPASARQTPRVSGRARKNSPNIVFILADDLGWADLSSYGRRDYQTAALDRLAQHGVRLTQAYANSSICTPTRVAFFTGRYQQRVAVGLHEPLGWNAGAPPGSLPGIPPEHPTIASLLRESGYHTALIGKWHAGYLPQYGPNKSGFEEFFGIFSGGVDYFTHRDGAGQPDLWEDETPVEKTGYITDLISERAIESIRRSAARRQPFYLSVHYTAPHWPWEGPGDEAVSRKLKNLFHLDGGSAKVYAEMVTRLDAGIGRILAALEDAGVANDTIVVFTSDNGGERFSDMWPFTGSKGGVYEGSHRVPAIIRYPGVLPEGTVSEQVAITFDWTATLLAAGGAKSKPAYPLDGIDLVPLLGKAVHAARPRQLFWRLRGQRAVRDGELKYIRLADPSQVQTQGGLPAALLGTEFLFDIARDPGERANLLEARPADAARLNTAWEAWNKRMLGELSPRRPG